MAHAQTGIPAIHFQEATESYNAALNKGENREVVMVNWLGTHLYQSGHSSLSVGTLNLADGSSDEDEISLYRYELEIR